MSGMDKTALEVVDGGVGFADQFVDEGLFEVGIVEAGGEGGSDVGLWVWGGEGYGSVGGGDA